MNGKKHVKLFVALVLLVLAAHALLYYRGVYVPPKTVLHNLDISVPEAPVQEFREKFAQGDGMVLVDRAHDNAFDERNFSGFFSSLASKGYRVEYVADGNLLEDKLAEASAFVSIQSVKAFQEQEIVVVQRFASRGGRILLIADPEKSHQANSLATAFDLFFESGYLYDFGENDGNFRYPYFSQFAGNALFKGVKKLAFYIACSVAPNEKGIVFSSKGTKSTAIESRASFSPVALNGGVLALCDQTFLSDQFNESAGNKQFSLRDFPYLFRGRVDIVYSPKFLRVALALKGLLDGKGLEANVVAPGQGQGPASAAANQIIVTDFGSKNLVGENAAAIGLTTEPALSVNGIELDHEGSGIVALVLGKEKNVLLFLAEKEAVMQTIITHANQRSLDSFLLNDGLAVFASKEAVQEKPQPVSGAQPQQPPAAQPVPSSK